MAASTSLNATCNYTEQSSSEQQLKAPDPDIAGPGVIIGFLLTGALTFVSSCIVIWLRRLSSQNQDNHVLVRRLTPRNATGRPVAFWIAILERFVIELSDQQLLLGLLLIICAYIKYWDSAMAFGTDNLWTAGDIVCFSIFTHATTLLSLRPHFRHHLRLATFRIVTMFIVYGLWLIVGIMELNPNKPKNSEKKESALSQFWHAAVVIEALAIFWIYLICYLPLFLSKEATAVRDAISKRDERHFDEIRSWIMYHRRRRSTGFASHTGWRRHNPYAVIRRRLTRLAVKFAEFYIKPMTPSRRWWLWLAAELMFPWYIASIVLSITWLFSLGALIVSLIQSGLASDTWSFGQLLPAVLVLLPFGSFVTAVAESGENTEHHSADSHDKIEGMSRQNSVANSETGLFKDIDIHRPKLYEGV